MDESVDKIINLANQNKTYLVVVTLITILQMISMSCIQSANAFYELMPMVNISYSQKLENTEAQSNLTKTLQLTYEICDSYPNYLITQDPEFSLVSYFGIECNRLKVGLLNIVGIIGGLLGTISISSFVNCFGVKRTLLIGGYSFTLAMVISSFMSNIYFFCLSLFIIGFFVGLSLNLAFMHLAEISSNHNRSIVTGFVSAGFNISAIIFIIIMQKIGNWKTTFLIGASSNLFTTIIIHICFFENPRYFVKSKKLKDFLSTLQDIASFNKCNINFEKDIMFHFKEESTLLISKENNEYSEICNSVKIAFEHDDNLLKNSSNYSIYHVFKFKSQRNKFLLLSFIWFSTNAAYMGLSLGIKNLPGEVYLNGLIVNPIEGTLMIVNALIMNINSIGRKKLILINLLISLILLIILNFIRLQDIGLTTLSLITRLCFASITGVLATYSTEIYTAKIMNSAMSFNILFGVLGSIFSPLVIEIFSGFYLNIIYFSTTFLSLICMLFLSETLNKPIPIDIPEELEVQNNKFIINKITDI